MGIKNCTKIGVCWVRSVYAVLSQQNKIRMRYEYDSAIVLHAKSTCANWQQSVNNVADNTDE